MDFDFWRALGVWFGALVVSVVLGYMVDPTGLFVSVESNIALTVLSIPVMALFAYFYFATPALQPSAQNGLRLGVFMIAVSFVLGVAGALAMPPAEPLLTIPYELLFLVGCVAIGAGVPALVGHYMAKK